METLESKPNLSEPTVTISSPDLSLLSLLIANGEERRERAEEGRVMGEGAERVSWRFAFGSSLRRGVIGADMMNVKD